MGTIRAKVKVLQADNGVVIADHGACSVEVVKYGEGLDQSEIFKAIGMAVYGEWLAADEEQKEGSFGVELRVEFRPIKKDVIFKA